ncbi:hypothetical protein J2T56_000618 [Natronobacillus azotifigens]
MITRKIKVIKAKPVKRKSGCGGCGKKRVKRK